MLIMKNTYQKHEYIIIQRSVRMCMHIQCEGTNVRRMISVFRTVVQFLFILQGIHNWDVRQVQGHFHLVLLKLQTQQVREK